MFFILNPDDNQNQLYLYEPLQNLRKLRENNRRQCGGCPYKNLSSQCCRNVAAVAKTDSDAFSVNLDVQHFTPEEITVKLSEDNSTIIVEGKHEERQDEHGFISRQFVRKYLIPKDYDVQKLQSNLSSDGVLTITAPKLKKENKGERIIPISLSREPVKVQQSEEISQKKEE